MADGNPAGVPNFPNLNLTKRRRIVLGYFELVHPQGQPGRIELRFTCKWGGHCQFSRPWNLLHDLHMHEYASRQAFLNGEPFYDCPGERA